MTAPGFFCPNCKRWRAREIGAGDYHTRRTFSCEFCGHVFTENQSGAEYDAADAIIDHDLEPEGTPLRQPEVECDLCGRPIERHGGLYDLHGYGECVEMPDNFMSIYFDELRHRGVAIVRMWRDKRERFDMHNGTQLYQRDQPGYPREVKFRVMMCKGNALANAYYVAKREALAAVIGDRLYWHVDDRILAKIEVPSYETMRNMLLDGDFVDDGDPTGGDYVLACRAALQITASRYRFPHHTLTST